MKIAVIGSGYVGLVTGTCLAETGNEVTCIDINEAKIKLLKEGKLPIYEPDLDVYFERNIKAGRLGFTSSLAEGVAGAKVIFLALPTPPDEDGSADLQHVLSVADQLGAFIKSYTVVVNKSTVPVGTADLVRERIQSKAKCEFDVVSNPEFLREGAAVEDFMKPDRVVIGTSSPRARKIMEDLYEPFVRQGNPIIVMDERSAEMTKYAANAFLATKISFMNEIANLCERTGADVDMVRKGIGADNRIGKRFLFAGVGYGGSCFPKDVLALYQISRKHDYDFKIVDAVLQVNRAQREYFFQKITGHFGGSIRDRKLAIWGLSYKPNTDDIREAPAVYLIEMMLQAGATVSAYDPEAMNNIREKFGQRISLAKNKYEALQDADALIITTEWNEFRSPDFDLMAAKLKRKIIFDGRNLYNLENMRTLGFTYYSIGRSRIISQS
ncbi:MAG: UDP-glucose/GDP-mannose dehydrogenase family protein [Chitinophagales bacterium]|nr:UDP-glucose/GDP-mannose dehydrogenase family protein [Chitinophagales bacterium]MDW8419117.1 UDP-glucose/GDP-mannose dehydrogenase family protein [Chitinophagales bacterium]